MKPSPPLALAALFLSAAAAFADPTTKKVVDAANAFLSSLGEEKRQAVVFKFDDAAQRVRWSNLPIRSVRRAGISLKDMNDDQRRAAMAFLATLLSPRGFEKIQQIMDGDQQLTVNSRDPGMFGRELYYFSLLGAPSETDPWMVQFGGHHLALNITIVGSHGVLTPSLTGAQPSLFTQNGRTVRPLAGESDKAIALLNALDETQRKQAVLSFRMRDLVLGPGKDGQTIQPEGLKATEMNAAQRELLVGLISEWVGIVQEEAAQERLQEVKAGLDDTWFAWAGPTTVEPGRNIAAYYRIQGPKLVIEYAPQTLGGEPSMHVHAMYRDPTNDYGAALAKP